MSRLKAPERRKQLIDVATRLFAERGFDATTTAGIASAAGISEPILYRHFKSKQDLFVSIVTEVTRTTQDHWRDLMSNVTDPSDALRIISLEWPQHMRACSAEYQVIHNAVATSRDPTVREVLKQHYDTMEHFFSLMIEDGQRRGIFRPFDLKTGVWWIMNCGIGYTLIALSLGEVEGYSVEHAIDLTLRAILADGK